MFCDPINSNNLSRSSETNVSPDKDVIGAGSGGSQTETTDSDITKLP